MITQTDIKRAHLLFEANEQRNLFYRAATELVALAIEGKTSLSVGEALAVLLQTWNRAYYRYHKCDVGHFESLETLCRTHQKILAAYRLRTIDSLNDSEIGVVSDLFQVFETVVGPVGAAKVLHLLAASVFPLWDRAIAKAYTLPLGRSGSNGARYWQFMVIARHQYVELMRRNPRSQNLLKLIDEYNYCKYTKQWLS